MQPSLLQSLIPPAKLPAIEKALQQTFNTTGVSEISLLAGGLSTSAVYKIIVHDQPYVLKSDNAEAAPNSGTEAPPDRRTGTLTFATGSPTPTTGPITLTCGSASHFPVLPCP